MTRSAIDGAITLIMTMCAFFELLHNWRDKPACFAIGHRLEIFSFDRILIIDFAGGEISTVPANLPLLKGSSIIGVFWRRFTEQEPKTNAENTTKLFQLLQQDKLKPHVSEIYPLEKSTMALEILEKRRVKGQVIINI
jgi:hypothetical protein